MGWDAHIPPDPEPNFRRWFALEPIAFFFVSHIDPFTTLTPPTAEAAPYLLLSDEVFTGRAQSLAPVVPEPGTIALLGSGLVGLYAAYADVDVQKHSDQTSSLVGGSNLDRESSQDNVGQGVRLRRRKRMKPD